MHKKQTIAMQKSGFFFCISVGISQKCGNGTKSSRNVTSRNNS